jgi:hypothetical protein
MSDRHRLPSLHRLDGPSRTGVGLLVAVAAVLSLVAAGCGGSASPGVASISTGTSSARSSDTTGGAGSPTALATCLTSHGFPASVGASGAGSGINLFGVTISGSVDPGSPQLQSAIQACRKYLPPGAQPSLTPAQRAEAVKAYTRFAACMRKNGVPSFPDPDPSSTTFFSPDSLKGIDPASPQVQQAFKTCQPLEPTIGPRLTF